MSRRVLGYCMIVLIEMTLYSIVSSHRGRYTYIIQIQSWKLYRRD